MTNSVDMKVVSYQLANTANDWQGDSVVGHVFKAPEASDGGGIYIARAYYIDQAAHGAGTAFLLRLLNYGTAGTAVEGTIGSVGGTADPVGAGVPKAFTLTAAQQYVDAGEWIVLLKDETNSSDPTRGTVVIEYLIGA